MYTGFNVAKTALIATRGRRKLDTGGGFASEVGGNMLLILLGLRCHYRNRTTVKIAKVDVAGQTSCSIQAFPS